MISDYPCPKDGGQMFNPPNLDGIGICIKCSEQFTEEQLIEAHRVSELTDKEKVIESLHEQHLFYTDADDPNLTVYVWCQNIWKSHSEAIILKEMFEIFGEEKPQVRKEELFDYFKGHGQNTVVEPKPPNLIPFTNGLYNIDTGRLGKHTPKYFCKNLIPWEHDKKAKCDKWLEFIKDIHEPEDIDFIQEWFGYHLYTSYPTKAFLICIGSGHNGKTVELTILNNVLGVDNVTAVSLQEINYVEYAPSELENKLGNISDDISNRKIGLTSKLKILSDGGWVSARKIYGHPYKFVNYAKITNSCNDPPEIMDDTDAIWDRLKAINYPMQFVENPDLALNQKQKIDRDQLVEELTSEIPGIINWMITGLKRLKKNKWVFSLSYSTKEIRQYYRRKSKPIIAWMEDELEWTGDEENDYVRKDEIYSFFNDWCEVKNIKPIPTRNKFFRCLRDEGIESRQVRDLDMARVYKGYKCNRITGLHTTVVQKENNINIERGKGGKLLSCDKTDSQSYEPFDASKALPEDEYRKKNSENSPPVVEEEPRVEEE